MKPRPLVAALALLAIASAGHAMGNAQDCQPEDLAPVDAWLARHPWKVGYTQADGLVASACKSSPVDANLLLVAAAYAQDQEMNKNIVVAVVDTKRNAVRAAYQGVVVEQEFLRIEAGSLRLDTSRYNLAAGVRAFGVDVMSSVNPVCAPDITISTRSLFVEEAASLRPVLNGLVVESAQTAACPREGQSGTLVVTTIALSPQSSHGFANLVTTATRRRAHAPDQPAGRGELRYDGTAYRRADGTPIAPLLTPQTAPQR